jgi:probable HAF family extracellular repeat protein
MTNPVGSGTDLAVAINASGQVAGAAGAHAALWSGGTKTDLGTLGGNLSRATGINAAGQVIGVSKTASGATHAFIWSGGVMTDLVSLAGASGSSVATAINSSGQVAGTSTTAGGTVHAFSWKNGVMTDLGTLGGTASMASSPTALAVSPATPPGGAWTTSMAGIPLASPNLSTASPALLPRGRRAINDAGQIVGTSTTATGQTHAFVWTAGVMKDLGTLGGTYSEGAAINSLGQATGVANVTGDTASHGFLYDPAGCL